MASERERDEDDLSLDDTLLDESDDDFDKRTASDDDTIEEDAEEEPAGSDDGVGGVLDAIGRLEALKAGKEAESAAFLADMETHLPGYEAPSTEPLSPIELVAQKVAAMNDNDRNAFMAELQKANNELYASFHGGESGDDDGAGDVGGGFDPTTLDSEGFAIYVRAAASGGAIARETPAGYTRESWAQAVASSLGKG